MPERRPLSLSTSIDFASSQVPERLRLQGGELVTHYLLPILSVVTLLLLLLFEAVDLLSVAMPVKIGLAVVAIGTLIFRYRLLGFRRLDVDCSSSEVIDLLLQAAESVGWGVLEERSDLLVFGTLPLDEAPHNAGERITFVLRPGATWVNCINDPANRLEIYSGSNISGNVEWIEGVLRDGLFRYEPEKRSLEAWEKKRESDFSFTLPVPERPIEPAIDELLEKVSVEGGELRHETARSSGERKNLATEGILFFSFLCSILLDFSWNIEYDLADALVVALIGALLLLLVTYLMQLYERSRFYTLRIEEQQQITYERLHQALEESGWYVGGVDKTRGIVARMPYHYLTSSTAVLFVIHDNRLNVKLFSHFELDYYTPKTVPSRLLLLLDWLYRWQMLDGAVPAFRPEAGSGWRAFLFKLRARRPFVWKSGTFAQLGKILRRSGLDPEGYREDAEVQHDWTIRHLIGSTGRPIVRLYGWRLYRAIFDNLFSRFLLYLSVSFGLAMLGVFAVESSPGFQRTGLLVLSTLLVLSIGFGLLENHRRR